MGELRHSGAETMLYSGADLLSPDGRSHVISVFDTLGDYAPYLERAGYRVGHYPVTGRKGQVAALKAFMRREQFDCMHIHTERRALLFSWIARSMGVASVRSIHNEFGFTGALRLLRTVTRQTARLLGTLHIACSARVQRNEKARFGLDTVVVENWIDVRRLSLERTEAARSEARARLGIPAQVLVLVSIANEAPAKNLHGQFEGVMKAHTAGLDVRLYHCGAIGAELARQVADAPQGVLHALGTVDDIGTYIAAADGFLCAAFHEGGPIALLEAAATGLNCITTRVGLTEAFDGLAGVTFIPATPDGVADGIARLAATPPEVREERAAALSRFTLSRFVPEVGARAFRKLYAQAKGTPAVAS
jgi:glycosyltransferase involved in cell wall biosynthesis